METYEKENIKLINTDCLDYMSKMSSESVDLILTDPPYGTLNHKIETNVDMKKFIEYSYKVLKKDSFFLLFGMQPSLSEWIKLAIETGFKYKQELIWYKRSATSPFSEIGKVHENCILFTRGHRVFNRVRGSWTDVKEPLSEFYEVKTLKRLLKILSESYKDIDKLKEYINYIEDEKGMYQKSIKYSKTNEYATVHNELKSLNPGLQKIKSQVYDNYRYNSVVSFRSENMTSFGKNGSNFKHPTVKPVKLFNLLIRLCSNKDEIVFDPFLGSGTSVVSCIETNRKCFGIELDNGYFEMCKDRIDEKFNNFQKRLF